MGQAERRLVQKICLLAQLSNNWRIMETWPLAANQRACNWRDGGRGRAKKERARQDKLQIGAGQLVKVGWLLAIGSLLVVQGGSASLDGSASLGMRIYCRSTCITTAPS